MTEIWGLGKRKLEKNFKFDIWLHLSKYQSSLFKILDTIRQQKYQLLYTKQQTRKVYPSLQWISKFSAPEVY